MIQTFRDLLVQWNATYGERTKMQHAYLVLSVVGIVFAGLVGLLNYDSSRAILRVCFMGLGIFLVNGVVWALLYSLVINKLPARRVPSGRK